MLNSCAAAPFAAGNPRTIPEDFAGMVHAGRTRAPKEYALLDEMHVSWILNTFYWSSIEPVQGVWNYLSTYDAFVKGAQEAGKKILACLAYDTPWLYSDRKTLKYVSPENIPRYLEFVERTVSRYRGKIDAWEIWNEPNWTFWTGSNKEFYELTRLTAQKIRETDPDALILGGAFWRVPENFINGMFQSGAMENVNAVAFHPYAVNPENTVKQYDKMLKVLSRHNYTGDIWVTEVGYPTGGWYPTRVSEDQLPSYVVKTLTGLAIRGARTVFWYELFDSYNKGQSPTPRDSEHFFGLVYPDYTRKMGAAAWELCARYMAGTEYRPDIPVRTGVPGSVEALYFRGSDTNTLILWNNKNRTVPLRISVSGPGLLHDIVSGAGQPVTQETDIELGNTPRILTWQGGTDAVPPHILLNTGGMK
ncbi:hypothetical protein FACS1894142_4200 [Spirochaetia bacterium]|nr:hypothetical protein FACS1894142_4200 [Spirochaetia bacterium]